MQVQQRAAVSHTERHDVVAPRRGLSPPTFGASEATQVYAVELEPDRAKQLKAVFAGTGVSIEENRPVVIESGAPS
jgi:hypothetical protein